MLSKWKIISNFFLVAKFLIKKKNPTSNSDSKNKLILVLVLVPCINGIENLVLCLVVVVVVVGFGSKNQTQF
jgi:hypothetical protein